MPQPLSAGNSRSIPARAGETKIYRRQNPGPGVHPRACGGNCRPPARHLQPRGSIPARAGETLWELVNGCDCQVHPRACGGNRAIRLATGNGNGPSPRVRGKLVNVPGGDADQRSIPARAGETGPRRSPASRSAVHPRACGGNVGTAACVHLARGPSPRVRGKRVLVLGIHYCTTVHPRACGGNYYRSHPRIWITGPSPRVRGKPRPSSNAKPSVRSIPARAGETAAQTRKHAGRTVHPRACGGNCVMLLLSTTESGPSPRVRGKLSRSRSPSSRARSIPARAGETRSATICGIARPVHPRACGGNTGLTPTQLRYIGPSPRVRGKLFWIAFLVGLDRSIPARAGETPNKKRRLVLRPERQRSRSLRTR